MELNIWCDESIKDGPFFSNFYGGVLVRSKDLRFVEKRLEDVCQKHHLLNELKWQRVTENYLEKYKALMDAFFQEVKADRAKVRIMFTQNARVPTHLTTGQRDNRYFLLYYQFIKHIFGLEFSNENKSPVWIRLYLDYLPDTIRKKQEFKEYIRGLQQIPGFEQAKIRFREDAIAEVDSKKHRLLQCLDVVLGAMAWRLNDMHKEKQPGKRVRGKRTRAKEELFKHISSHIRQIYPNFNIGESTGLRDNLANKWEHSYRHWKFTPSEFKTDAALFKHR